ncbi:hypothetical protein GGI19_003238 [Coemansia pectinata]|uniref:V-SNARE coiled-coil homology domain-containing protein n=2 Tax=Coemansia TaxID=4863 RepID=A0A9W8LAI3_9FUNG|nr:hypothetical protein GGI19_003238 [Coemansia pectinata]
MSKRDVIQFEGHQFLKQRLVFSILSQRPVRIDNIRSNDTNPGLRDFEISLLRLLEKATNGTRIVISHTGSSVALRPGMITGGRIEMDCPVSRGIGYYLEALVALAPFGKEQMVATLRGVTMNNTDLSVDTIRTATLVNYRNFGIEEGVELRITKRGAPPKGGGEVRFICPVVRAVKPIQFIDAGKIRRIRGISYATRVSPQTANRMVEAARGELNKFIPDIYIYTDVYKGAESGFSPGFGISLVAESTTGVLMTAELCANPGDAPEDIGRDAAKILLTEISRGGCFDSSHQWLALLLMVLGPEHASKTRIGKLTPFTIQYLRDIKEFFNIAFKIKPDPESNTVIMTCMGSGYINVGKKTTSYNTNNNPGNLESGYGYGGGNADKGFGSQRRGDDSPQDIYGGGGGDPHSKGHKVQQEVDKVVDIMNENIQMVMARGENLKDLDDRTGQLNDGAAQFRRNAADVRKTMWWRNMRLRIILAGVVVLLIIIIVVPIVVTKK